MDMHDSYNDEITPASQVDTKVDGGRKFGTQHDEYLSRYQTASSVVIPREVFETMYLSPYNRREGHLHSIFGNPTPMYVLPYSRYMHANNST